MKRCGNCAYYVHIRSWENPGGICDKFDWRIGMNSGRKCPDHKPIKYDRKKTKSDTVFLISEG